MRKEELDTLLSMISKLKPHEWNQIVHYVQKSTLPNRQVYLCQVWKS